jgi:glycosyltransferase involved in cell wall biosynthesis
MKPTISVCTIVKNERDRIQDFFESLVGFADEIVIVDTGSTDDTVAIIEDFISTHDIAPIHFLKFTATGQFHYGDAKNFSIDRASKDYAIILDADERLTGEFKQAVRDFILTEAPVVASVVRKDELLPHLIDYPERIVKRDSNVRYGVDELSRVHEQLIHTVPSKSFPGVILHEQRWNHYVIRPQRIFFQLELQVDRIPKTKTLFGHILRGVWYFCYRFKKIYFERKLYKDGRLGFKYAFMRALDAFLIQLFVGLKPSGGVSYWKETVSEK